MRTYAELIPTSRVSAVQGYPAVASCEKEPNSLHKSSFATLAVAWFAVALASDLDSIVADIGGFHLPAWSALARATLLVVVALLATERSSHERGFVFALAALTTGSWVVDAIQRNVHWFVTANHADAMFARVFTYLIPAGLVSVTLIRSGLSRRDLFLQRGELDAHASLPLIRGARWNVVAPVLLLLISAGLVTQLWIVSRASQHLHLKVLLWGLPAAVVFAIINASWEEFCFRCVLLARGVRAFGPTQAITTSSVLFGLAHYGGHPSGFSGVLMAAFFAWIVARSMVDTRGWAWAWVIHFVQDVIIFSMVAVTSS